MFSMSATVSMFARYVWVEHFPTSAFINIGVTFTLSFVQIGLAATDLAFTSKTQKMKHVMYALWFVVYWGTIISGTILMKFYMQYWQSGRFSVASKCKFALKKLLIQILAVTILVGLLYFVVSEIYDEGIFESAMATILILSNVYGMLLLVLLLSHSLIKLPIYLWKYTDNGYQLINALSRAERVRKAYRQSLIEYHEQISICKTLEDQHCDKSNRDYFRVLMDEIPENDLEG